MEDKKPDENPYTSLVQEQVFRVKLRDCAEHEVIATDKHDAIEQYKRWAGVIDTIHPFEVSPVE